METLKFLDQIKTIAIIAEMRPGVSNKSLEQGKNQKECWYYWSSYCWWNQRKQE
jgi:hypothetical protein